MKRVALLCALVCVRMGVSDEELVAGVRAGGFTGQLVAGKDLGRS